MIIANPDTIARVLLLLQGDAALEELRWGFTAQAQLTSYKPDGVPEGVPRHPVRLSDVRNVPRGVLLSCLSMTRGGAFVCLVAHVAERLAEHGTQSAQSALDLAQDAIYREWHLADAKPEVKPPAASAVALLALQVNGRWSLETFADLGEAWPSALKGP